MILRNFISLGYLLVCCYGAWACGPVFVFEEYKFVTKDFQDPTNIIVAFQNNLKTQGQPDLQKQENLKEWKAASCSWIELEEIEQVIYHATIPSLEAIKQSIEQEGNYIDRELAQNGFALYLHEQRCLATVDYLLFAKKCEPLVTQNGDPWTRPQKNKSIYISMLNEGAKLFEQYEDPFIRMRTAYQIVRLAHYSKDYQKTIDLYDYLLPKIGETNSQFKWWMLAHRAGALKKLGQRVEAAYLFSKVYAACPAKREPARLSFYIKTAQEWQDCLLRAQSISEKITLYELRAQMDGNRTVTELTEIYSLDPTDPSIDPLLDQSMRRLEKALLGADFYPNRKVYEQAMHISRKSAQRDLVKLNTLVDKMIVDSIYTNQDKLKIYHAWLPMFENKPKVALDRLEQLSVEKKYREDVEAMTLAAQVDSYQKIDYGVESDLFNLMDEHAAFKDNLSLKQWTDDRVSYLYKQSNNDQDRGKAFLWSYSILDQRYNPDETILKSILALSERKDPTRLEKQLLFDPVLTHSTSTEALTILGRYYLSRGKIETANEILNEIPHSARDSTNIPSPFVEDFRDYVNKPVIDSIHYNIHSLVKKLNEMDYQARADMKKGPTYFYLLGIAWYNMSYFGPSWQAIDYFRSGANWEYANAEDVYPLFGSAAGNFEYHNLDKAVFYLEKALALSKNKELQARAAFMLARCEQKQYFLSKDCSYRPYKNQIPKLTAAFDTYYMLLMHSYADTKFYAKVAEECKFLKAYIGK